VKTRYYKISILVKNQYIVPLIEEKSNVGSRHVQVDIAMWAFINLDRKKESKKEVGRVCVEVCMRPAVLRYTNLGWSLGGACGGVVVSGSDKFCCI